MPLDRSRFGSVVQIAVSDDYFVALTHRGYCLAFRFADGARATTVVNDPAVHGVRVRRVACNQTAVLMVDSLDQVRCRAIG